MHITPYMGSWNPFLLIYLSYKTCCLNEESYWPLSSDLTLAGWLECVYQIFSQAGQAGSLDLLARHESEGWDCHNHKVTICCIVWTCRKSSQSMFHLDLLRDFLSEVFLDFLMTVPPPERSGCQCWRCPVNMKYHQLYNIIKDSDSTHPPVKVHLKSNRPKPN